MFRSFRTLMGNRNLVLRRRFAGALAALAMGFVQPSGSTYGVTFNVSLAPGSVLPGFDPTGANLVAIVDAAGDYWSNIILDQFTFNIQVGYGTGGGNQAFACYDAGGACVDGVVLPAIPSDAFIEFNSLQGGGSFAPYFFDSTPNNHSEFALSQTLFRDLSPGNQSFFYDVTPPPPDLFEAGYQGGADVGGPADNRVDAYSVALHEIGHLLGMINEIAQPESSDDHYDIDPDFVAGDVVRVRTLSNDNEHLNDTLALMQSTLGAEVRALPSATDVLSIVAGSNPKWTLIDLPRKEFLAGTVWDLSGNWLGHRLPDGEDDVFIRHGGEVSVLLDQEAGNLTIAEGSNVTLSTSELTVNDTLRVEGAGSGTATFTVPAGSLLDAATVQVGDDGQFGTNGSIFDTAVTANNFTIEPGGVATGNGRISANSINNSGTVVAFSAFGGTNDVLALDATGGGTVNLDGDGNGQLFAVLGSLLVSGPLSDSFDGEITVGQGRTIFFDEPWTFAPGLGGAPGTINLNGGASDAALATINTDTWSAANGQINVAGKANVVGTTTLGANIAIDVANGGTLDLDGVTTFQGGTYTGLGTIVLNNNMVVATSTTVDISRFDLDGDSFGQTLTLNAPVTLNVDFVDTGNNVFNADEIDINFNGRLAVNLNNPNASWRMAGTLNINLGLFPQTVLTGSPVEITGTVNADGASFLTAPLDISGQVNFADGQTRVMLSGPSSLRRTQHIIRSDATLSGLGVLEITSTAALDLEDGAAVGVFVENDGLLTVAGDMPGVAGLGSDYRQTGDGELTSTIAGHVVGDGHDQIGVAGFAELAGELRVVIADGFIPNDGDQFTVLDASALFDEFDTVSVLDEEDVLGYEYTVLYSPPGENGNVIVQIDASFLIGDYNHNGVVDAADFPVWRDLLGAPAGSLPNDIDGGVIGQAQYSTWKSHFGNTLPGSGTAAITGAPSSAIAPVPEPATEVLMILAIACVSIQRRWCASRVLKPFRE